jgi:hypothetical protein
MQYFVLSLYFSRPHKYFFYSAIMSVACMHANFSFFFHPPPQHAQTIRAARRRIRFPCDDRGIKDLFLLLPHWLGHWAYQSSNWKHFLGHDARPTDSATDGLSSAGNGHGVGTGAAASTQHDATLAWLPARAALVRAWPRCGFSTSEARLLARSAVPTRAEHHYGDGSSSRTNCSLCTTQSVNIPLVCIERESKPVT